jgi:hypothetical protein
MYSCNTVNQRTTERWPHDHKHMCSAATNKSNQEYGRAHAVELRRMPALSAWLAIVVLKQKKKTYHRFEVSKLKPACCCHACSTYIYIYIRTANCQLEKRGTHLAWTLLFRRRVQGGQIMYSTLGEKIVVVLIRQWKRSGTWLAIITDRQTASPGP